ncbi:MAG: hypothetical protein ACHP7N_03380 [Caulobacterales bacterium]
MSARVPINIEALVDQVEKPGLVAAAEQLSEYLGEAAAAGEGWPVYLRFHPAGGAPADLPAHCVIVTSLLQEVHRLGEPIIETEARWRAQLGQLQASGAPVFVCTVFRYVRDQTREGTISPVLERIHRLNRMAMELSHDLGVAVIDLDRAFADLGGRTLQTDYRLSGLLAAEVAGHTAAWSLLSFGLDDMIDPELQEKAKTILGDLRNIQALVTRRLARRQTAQAARQSVPRG